MQSVITKFQAYLLTEKRVAHHTFNAYKIDLKQYTDFLQQQSITLQDANLTHIKLFLQHLKATGITARSMARKISSFKAFYQWAHEHIGWENYTTDLASPKLDKKLPTYLTEQEIEELLSITEKDNSPSGYRNRIMVYLLYTSGMRVSELVQIKLPDIHEDTGCMVIHGKGNKERMIPLPIAMMQLLKDYIKTIHQQFVVDHGATEYLFPIIYGSQIKHISRQAFWYILKNLCKQTTIGQHISPHTLRHSLATHLLKNGADLRSLQLLLGHEQVSTVQIYTHLELGHLRKEYDKKHPRS